MSATASSGRGRSALLAALSAVTLLIGSGDLWRGGTTISALCLAIAYAGLIPATLFALALRVAPTPHTVATTVGWMQQWSSMGQFAGPPAVAAVASAVGGWHHTGLVTGACCVLGVATAFVLSRQTAGPATAHTRPAGPG
jgi:hypothetical protein